MRYRGYHRILSPWEEKKKRKKTQKKKLSTKTRLSHECVTYSSRLHTKMDPPELRYTPSKNKAGRSLAKRSTANRIGPHTHTTNTETIHLFMPAVHYYIIRSQKTRNENRKKKKRQRYLPCPCLEGVTFFFFTKPTDGIAALVRRETPGACSRSAP